VDCDVAGKSWSNGFVFLNQSFDRLVDAAEISLHTTGKMSWALILIEGLKFSLVTARLTYSLKGREAMTLQSSRGSKGYELRRALRLSYCCLI